MFFKNLVNFYIARNRLDLRGSLPTLKQLDICIIGYVYDNFTLQEDIKTDGKVSKTGELLVIEE